MGTEEIIGIFFILVVIAFVLFYITMQKSIRGSSSVASSSAPDTILPPRNDNIITSDTSLSDLIDTSAPVITSSGLA